MIIKISPIPYIFNKSEGILVDVEKYQKTNLL